jgi:hypothetical protein
LISVSRLVAGVALAAGLASAALAQDELPKDAPPPPKAQAPALPAETPDAGSALPPGTMVDQPVAVLQALDKITARVKRLPVKIGEAASTFGTLSIQVMACRKAPPEDSPEAAAFLKITDTKSEPAQVVFSGWMFASSPALSAMDHPVYDISVVDCTSDTTVAGSTPPVPTPAAAPAPVAPAPAPKR